MPVFLLLLFAMIFCAWYLGISHSLQQIAADVGRYAMVGLTPQEREALINRRITADAGQYVLIRQQNLKGTGVEKNGALTVTLDYDASYLPTPQLLTEAIGLPSSIQRTATVLLP
ncbi:pilus assembly protein [Jiella sp. MQZ9-1]|uniref:Pilus assembly protein n=2 Tax=Jiella flava TaxID=2816857 RepID=A0A939JSH6_9HYPH|nr:pilus assembly protein [Jiella flava]MCD2469747.1 pilus assembly protein [Jiella flava]